MGSASATKLELPASWTKMRWFVRCVSASMMSADPGRDESEVDGMGVSGIPLGNITSWAVGMFLGAESS